MSEAQEIMDYHGAKRKTELWIQNLTVDNMLREWGYIRSKTDDPLTQKLIGEYFDTSKSFRKALKSGNRTKVLNNLAKYDTKLKALDAAGETKKAKFMEDVFGYMKFKNGDELAGLVNNIDKIDLSAVEEGRGLEELAKKVWRKVKSTTTLDQFNVFIKESAPKIVQSTVVTPSASSTVTAADEVVENVPSGSTVEASADLIKNRDEVYKAVDTELTDLNSKIKWYDIDVNSSITGKYYKNQLESLETFRNQTKLFTDQELTAFKKLKDLDFKASHISELFALGELNSSVKTALKQGNDVDGLMKVLMQQDEAIIKAGGNVSQDLIRWLENIKIAKQTVKYGDEMVDVWEVMFKFLSKVF